MAQKVKTHKDLDVWKRSVDLVTDIYRITQDFPQNEIYGLTSQIRRAAISIPTNIAEGAGRSSSKEFAQFLNFAVGSISELETQLIISERFGFIESLKILEDVVVIRKQLVNLVKSLRKGYYKPITVNRSLITFVGIIVIILL